MNIHDYLDYVDIDMISKYRNSKLVEKHVTFFSETTNLNDKLKYDVAFLGVPDEGSTNQFEAADQIRQQFFSLASLSNSLNIVDLGNIKKGHSFKDTCYAISEIVAITLEKNILVILIGGASKYNLGSYLAFEKNQIPMNMVSVDSMMNKDKIHPIVSKELNINNLSDSLAIFNFINIGYQSYFVEKEFIDFINDSYYEAYRLGFVRANLLEMEPCLRDTNLINFSLNAIKYSDAPGAGNSSPNGLTGEEACQIAFYAGHSNRVRSFGLSDFSPQNDFHFTTAKLSAQIIWYFLEGYSSSIYEEPDTTPENFTKFIIHLDQTNQNIAFFKSNLTNRWWMEIKYEEDNRNILLSCSETDYEVACHQGMPERWWRTFQRISQ